MLQNSYTYRKLCVIRRLHLFILEIQTASGDITILK